MPEKDKIPKISNGISFWEFRKALSRGAYSERDSKKILTIFNELSFNDKILSLKEWELFKNAIDSNKDSYLSNYEMKRMSFNSKLFEVSGEKGLYITNEDIINFYNLMKEIIKEGYDKIPDIVANRLEYSSNNQYITNIIPDKDTTYVEYTQLPEYISIVEFDNKTGQKLTEIIKNNKGIITNIISYDSFEYPEAKSCYEPNLLYGDIFLKQEKESIGRQMVISSARNLYRNGGYDEGFTGNWLYCDKYNSKTFDEFQNNLKLDGLQYDEEAGNNMVVKAAYLYKKNKRKYKRNCAAHVFDVLNNVSNCAGEKLIADMDCKDAYKNAFQISKNKNFIEIPYNIVSTMDLRNLPKGCIKVCDANYKQSYGLFLSQNEKHHAWGHIDIITGDGYGWGGGKYSVYDMAKGRQKTHVRVFIPVKEITEIAEN